MKSNLALISLYAYLFSKRKNIANVKGGFIPQYKVQIGHGRKNPNEARRKKKGGKKKR